VTDAESAPGWPRLPEQPARPQQATLPHQPAWPQHTPWTQQPAPPPPLSIAQWPAYPPPLPAPPPTPLPDNLPHILWHPPVTPPAPRIPAFQAMSPRPNAVITAALDVLTSAARDIRTASLYIGLLVLLTCAPIALLFWRFTIEPLTATIAAAELSSVASFVALGGIFVATIESRAIAAALIAARLANERFSVREAVQRSRVTFWPLAGALLITNVPLFIAQYLLGEASSRIFGGPTEPAVVLAALVAAVLFAPLVYTVAGVVIGDADPIAAVKRSVGLFRTRTSTAVIVALFDFGAQFLTFFGLAAGLEVVLGALDATGFQGGEGLGVVVVGMVIAALLFAVGSLTFTVAAIAIAPQVAAFAALTHVAPGLDRLPGVAGFRWLTRPILVAVAIGALAMFGGMAAMD
jgi:hypothetical protein